MRNGFAFCCALVLAAGASPVLAQSGDGADWHPGSSSVREREEFAFGFTGVWAHDAAACADIDGIGQMTIYREGIDFNESGARLDRITASGQNREVLVALSFEGEGRFWDAVWTMALSPDSGALTITEGIDAPVTYIRCD